MTNFMLAVVVDYEPIREQNALIAGGAVLCFVIAYLGRGGKKKKR